MMKDTRGGVMTQRRRLLAGAGLAAAVPGRLLAAGAPDTLDPGASGVWDVIVAGSGAAGLSAAAAALESGAGRVLVLEKGPLVGGHSIYSSGSVSAVAPSRSHDPNDTLGRFVEDALEVGGDTGDAAVLAKIGEDSAGVLDWLESLGVFWSEPFIAYSGKQAKSYAMPGNSAGRSYVLALMAHLRRFGCRLALSTPVTGFRPEGHAWVVEVKSPQGARTLRTRSLVIACGGFTANVEARMKINPLLTPDVPTSANPAGTVFDGATGELIACAGRNGAFVTTGFGLQALPFWGGRLLDYQGADIYVDMHGRRFVNENSPWNVISNAILSLPERRCWVITDDRSFKGATLGVKLINGVVRKSDSIDAMAAAMDIEPVVLARTIEDYNRAADKGYDARTGKRLFRQRIERPPFYWGAERIYVHTTLDGMCGRSHCVLGRPRARTLRRRRMRGRHFRRRPTRRRRHDRLLRDGTRGWKTGCGKSEGAPGRSVSIRAHGRRARRRSPQASRRAFLRPASVNDVACVRLRHRVSAVRHVHVVRSPPAELHGIEHPEDHGGVGEDEIDDHRRDGRASLPDGRPAAGDEAASRRPT